MSDSASKRRAGDARVGLGDDERTRSATDRGADGSSGGTAYGSFGSRGVEPGRAASRPAVAPYRDDGGGALIHKGRGKTSNHRVNEGIRVYALELVRTQYRDFEPTLAIEALYERHGIKVGRETLRTWMREANLWASRKQSKTFHQPRLRRESYGELVQIDGSEHRWFENRDEPWVFIDDATSRLMQLSYFAALRGYPKDHGCPTAFYSDKHSVFALPDRRRRVAKV